MSWTFEEEKAETNALLVDFRVTARANGIHSFSDEIAAAFGE
jgi:hypothetical protein